MTAPQQQASPPPPATFDDLGLSELTMRAIRDVGYETPTPVQSGAVPIALTGRDVMVQSQTGTGKTAAFSLPLIEQICANQAREGVQAIILAPTRELARQVAQELTLLSAHHDLEVCTIYGGTPFDPQVAQLKTTDVVVGTPGRVVDHLKRRTLSLNAVRHFVLDEADEMLSMGFAEELEEVRKRLPKERQTLFFSATFPPAVKRYSERTLIDPELLSFLDETSSADDLEHAYYMVRGIARSNPLTRVLRSEDPKNAIIFVNTRRDCEMVVKALKRAGLDADRLSGDMDQKERERVMAKMKRKSLRFLVATDVAARGIDISQLSHVIHYQLPDSPEVYIHRSGRTGRAGEKGTVLSLIGPQEIGVLYALKRFHHLDLVERPLPEKVSAPASNTPARNTPANSATAKRRDMPSVSASSEPQGRDDRADSPSSKASAPAAPRAEERPTPDQPKRRTRRHAQRERTQEATSTRDTRSTSRQTTQRDTMNARPEPVATRAPTRPRQGRRAAERTTTERSSAALPLQRLIAELSEGEAHEEHLSLARALLSHERAEELICKLLALRAAPPPAEEVTEKSAQREPRRLNQTKTPEAPQRRRSQFDRLRVNIGRRDVSHVRALKELLAELGGLLPEDISSVQMQGSTSRIEVSHEFSRDLIDALSGEPFADRLIEVKLITPDRNA